LIFDLMKFLQIWRILEKKIYNSMIDLSKFTSNKKILNKIVVIDYNQVCSQTLFFFKNNIGTFTKILTKISI